MTIKLLPVQIPLYWEIIKYTITKADNVRVEDLSFYLNESLCALLNEKAQCWINYNEEKIISSMAITRIMYDKKTGEKYLFLQCGYSFQFKEDPDREKEFLVFKKFAENEKCSYIYSESGNKRLQELALKIGFKEITRGFRLDIGG